VVILERIEKKILKPKNILTSGSRVATRKKNFWLEKNFLSQKIF
jgi:hypothetical protein